MATTQPLAHLFPGPRPRPAPLEWDVFLSYRSVNRAWVIALYDVLTDAGFKVYLDQYVLVPGQPLTAGLEEALMASAAGVLVWSAATGDSEWVRKERTAMDGLRSDRKKPPALPFNFVVAKLDTAQLPLFLRNDLYTDFSAYPDGPMGAELVRLVHGINGTPLSVSAVKNIEELDAKIRDQLFTLRAARTNGDVGAIVAAAAADTEPWQMSAQLASVAGELLLEMKADDAALELVKTAQVRFPRALRLQQMMALAHRRKGDWKAAQVILGKLYEMGHRDPETLGIYAATWASRSDATGDVAALRRSRDLYAEAFAYSPGDDYCGVNAASKSALLGELDKSRVIADQVWPLVKGAKAADYWKKVTEAEVLLLCGDCAGSITAYTAARDANPTQAGSFASTRKQLAKLVKALAVVPPDAEALLGIFPER